MSRAAEFKWRYLLLAGILWQALAAHALGGPYSDSAHGSAASGVNRTVVDAKYAAYATGNCAHCHEAHASVDGGEPAPVTGPTPHALFAPAFNLDQVRNPYAPSDNFCFNCHSADSGPQVMNQDYSANFGGALAGATSQTIMDTFNQASYHNLYDISVFLNGSTLHSSWFAKSKNPCRACHDPHVAKRNWDSTQVGFPLLSAISRPGTTGRLWGETEVMSAYLGYEAPVASEMGREPAGVGDAAGGNTPDYVTFCRSCHTSENTIYSTDLGRNLEPIGWVSTDPVQDKHGALAREANVSLREPYLSAAEMKGNFILSCLDCHEPHGSPNTSLLRRRINGETLEETVVSTDTMGEVCRRCHTDDFMAGAGTGQVGRWEYVHHDAVGAPYVQKMCGDCHGVQAGEGTPIPCGNCHGHGMDDSWAGVNQTGRKTF